MTRIFLGGGGSEIDEDALWDEVFLPGQRVSIWPFALAPGPARNGSVQWLSAALRARGKFIIDPWGLDGADEDCSAQRLDGSDVLAIPGGNTFDLLHHLQHHCLLSTLGNFLSGGGRVYGGSAGATLLGADIAIAGFDDLNDAGVRDTRGLNCLLGAVVQPHYQSTHDLQLQQWAQQHDQVVLALPERSGVVVTDATARNVGPHAVHVFTPAGRRTYPSGAIWDLGET